MRIGIGIDTGGTCTDVVAYDLDEKKIIAHGKTPTTHEDLAVGICKAIDLLDSEILEQASAVALSTTLATNACVEDKTGQGTLILLSAHEDSFRDLGEKYGIGSGDHLVFVDSETSFAGEIKREPDWEALEAQLDGELSGCGALGIVEMYSMKTGSRLEKRVREMAQERGISTVCGYELFSEPNIIIRGAGTLLNAKLTSIIANFLDAVKTSMASHDMHATTIMVRSDSSLMVEEVARKRPVDTLLCGPAASVLGAVELCGKSSGIVIDMGGTTTDIAQVKDGFPRHVVDKTRIGRWETFVKSIRIDTFGLGGDSEVLVDRTGKLSLGTSRVMPMCMAATRFPKIKSVLAHIVEGHHKQHSWRNNIYVAERDISNVAGFSDSEKEIARVLYNNPQTIKNLDYEYGLPVTPKQLEHMIANAVVIRCGVTPTDAMHVKGDFSGYDADASLFALQAMSSYTFKPVDQLCEEIYDQVKKTLYFDVMRSLLANDYEGVQANELSDDLLEIIEREYQRARGCLKGNKRVDDAFVEVGFTCKVPLIGIGGPIGLFLTDVATMLGTEAYVSEYSGVANALGAIAGSVSATVSYEVSYDLGSGGYRIFGNGESFRATSLVEAEQIARQKATEAARAEALERGVVPEDLKEFCDWTCNEVDIGSDKPMFLGAVATATAYGTMMALADMDFHTESVRVHVPLA